MKKLLLLLVACLVLGGCGKPKKPEWLSDKAYEDSVLAIDTAESYLDGKIDGSEASKKLYGIEIDTERISELLGKMQKDDDGFRIDPELEFPRDIDINIKIMDIRTQISFISSDPEKNEDVKEKTIETIRSITNELKERINGN